MIYVNEYQKSFTTSRSSVQCLHSLEQFLEAGCIQVEDSKNLRHWVMFLERQEGRFEASLPSCDQVLSNVSLLTRRAS